jgi:hypothetical protein
MRFFENATKYVVYRQAGSFPIIVFARKVSMMVRNCRVGPGNFHPEPRYCGRIRRATSTAVVDPYPPFIQCSELHTAW